MTGRIASNIVIPIVEKTLRQAILDFEPRILAKTLRVRVTVQALAAALGGTQSLHTNSMDETIALPSDKAVKIALRTQQIIAHESGVANTVDPLGGSYFVEALTNEVEAGAWDYIEKIDAMGGMLRAIETGYVQAEIQKAAYEYQQAVERGEQRQDLHRLRRQREPQQPAMDGDREEAEQRICERVLAEFEALQADAAGTRAAGPPALGAAMLRAIINWSTRNRFLVGLAVLFIGGLMAASFWILRPFLGALLWSTMIVVACTRQRASSRAASTAWTRAASSPSRSPPSSGAPFSTRSCRTSTRSRSARKRA